jgi:GTPase SAR1 family protein
MFISDATTSLVLVGDAKTGKSSLISSYLSSNIREQYIPTTGIDIVRTVNFYLPKLNINFSGI